MLDLNAAADAGDAEDAKVIEAEVNRTASAVRRFLGRVKNGDLEVSLLSPLKAYCVNPAQGLASGQQPGPRALGGNPGQPAGLPSGAPQYSGDPDEDVRQAIQVIQRHPRVDEGQRNLLVRAFSDPSNPIHIRVLRDGTPEETNRARQEARQAILERDAMRVERDTLQRELDQERDENRPGSMAQKLKHALTINPPSGGSGTGGATSTGRVKVKDKISDALRTLNAAGSVRRRRILSEDEFNQVVADLNEAQHELG